MYWVPEVRKVVNKDGQVRWRASIAKYENGPAQASQRMYCTSYGVYGTDFEYEYRWKRTATRIAKARALERNKLQVIKESGWESV